MAGLQRKRERTHGFGSGEKREFNQVSSADCMKIFCLHLKPQRPLNMFTEVNGKTLPNIKLILNFPQFKAI